MSSSCFNPSKLKEMFVYHSPTPEALQLHNTINEQTLNLANWLNTILPRSAEVTLAIRALQEARHWANAAVALYITSGQEP